MVALVCSGLMQDLTPARFRASLCVIVVEILVKYPSQDLQPSSNLGIQKRSLHHEGHEDHEVKEEIILVLNKDFYFLTLHYKFLFLVFYLLFATR